jgi:hypothetical protein
MNGSRRDVTADPPGGGKNFDKRIFVFDTRGTLFDGRVHSDYRRARSPRPLTCCLDGERIASLKSSLRSVLEGRHVDLFQLAV